MAFFHRDENAAAGRAHFPSPAQRAFNRRAIIGQIDNVRGKRDWSVRRSWPQQFDRIFSRHRAGRMVSACVFHQMIGRGPIAMTVEQRADDAAIQHAGKRFVLRLRLPFGNDFAVFGKAADAQTVRIRRAATPTRIFGSVLFLKRSLRH